MCWFHDGAHKSTPVDVGVPPTLHLRNNINSLTTTGNLEALSSTTNTEGEKTAVGRLNCVE
jgi:hypothetical protein